MSKVKTVSFLVYADVPSLEACDNILEMLQFNNTGVRFERVAHVYEVGNPTQIKCHIAVHLDVVEEENE